jgi:hypothetical protein
MSARRSLTLLAAGSLAAGALALPAAAGANIVVGQSIAGMKPQMSFTQLKRLLGKPSYVTHAGKKVVTADWEGRKLYASFRLADGLAATVSTQSPRQRTAEGIHVGSKAAAVRAAYPQASCDSRTCFINVSDGVSTGFNFTRGRVDSIALVAP